MNRSRKLILVSHCLLNSNSKVEGLSKYKGVLKEFFEWAFKNGVGIIQLPCPEMSIYGINRWGHVKEQFDTMHFRKMSRKMLMPIVEQVKNYKENDYKIIGVLGVDGSPSCGVNKTCSSKTWKGELSGNEELDLMLKDIRLIDEAGVFMEELKKILKEESINLNFYAIDETCPNQSIEQIIK